MKVKVSKEELMKRLEDVDDCGQRWIKGHYLWPDFIELEAEPVKDNHWMCKKHGYGGIGEFGCSSCKLELINDHPKLPEELPDPHPARDEIEALNTLGKKVNQIIRYLKAQDL